MVILSLFFFFAPQNSCIRKALRLETAAHSSFVADRSISFLRTPNLHHKAAFLEITSAHHSSSTLAIHKHPFSLFTPSKPVIPSNVNNLTDTQSPSIATLAFIMADWNFEQGGSTHDNSADDGWNTGGNIEYVISLGRYKNSKSLTDVLVTDLPTVTIMATLVLATPRAVMMASQAEMTSASVAARLGKNQID